MRHPLILAALVCSLALPGAPAFAQYGGRGPQGQQQQQQQQQPNSDDQKKNDDWQTPKQLDIPGKRNAGPCPYVKVLWDAARYVELKNNKESYDAVGYTGEIQKLTSACEYRGSDPIHVATQILFEFGRGPAAQGSSKEFTYWVAVTDRNFAVLDKQYFTIRAVFPSNSDRVTMTDTIEGIMIPRANAQVSGGNFEVLVGFDVTPEMLSFNQAGKRFRINAGGPAQTATLVQQPPGQ